MCGLIKKIFRCYESEDFFSQIEYGKDLAEICRLRTKGCLEWYMRKAVFYKYLFYILSLINLALPLLSATIMAVADKKDIGITLAAITSLSASLLTLFNARDRWTNYRTAAENIKKQYSLYCGRVRPYDDERAHSNYLYLLEEYMAEVHTHWYQMQMDEIQKNNQEESK